MTRWREPSCRMHETRVRRHGDPGVKVVSGLKHGMYGTPEYNSWCAMKKRCYSPNGRSYKRYGGRGITVCDEWLASFEQFYKDMGRRPGPTYSVERLDNDKGYSPSNCVWADRFQQFSTGQQQIDQ
jgi:hypothetical protein